MQISRPQIIELRDALSDALGITEMDDVVTRLGQTRENITLPSNKAEMYREIVDWYNRQNRIDELIIVSRAVNTKNASLYRFAQTVGLAAEFPPEAADDAGLERIIRSYLPRLRVRDWLEKAAVAESRVCLVSDGDTALGTGFLIGRGAVLTNHHVVEAFIDHPADAVRLRFTFDFLAPESEAVYEPLPGDWLIDSSKGVTADTQALDAPADAPEDRLDYAVVRLDRRAGEDKVGGKLAPKDRGEARGWFVLPTQSYDFRAKRALLIYHHADGRPLELSIATDSYADENANGTRIWHRSNTEGGSSGSPCFDLEWNPVALHQGYNKLAGRRVNRAVPLVAVRRLLEERGKLGELEG